MRFVLFFDVVLLVLSLVRRPMEISSVVTGGIVLVTGIMVFVSVRNKLRMHTYPSETGGVDG
jgi:hypothetical protein